YRVDLAARDAWLRCMITALEADPPAEPMRSAMIEYFVRSADFMRNTEEVDGGV
ncbi:MAG: globin, partial [Actinobacteria bacterium]|nr:globin [Actinomycetota bacterium]